MADQRTSCMVDGDTFIGTFAEAGRGGEAAVTVRYEGQVRTAAVGGSSAAHTAQRLLSQLVQDHLAAGAATTAT